KIRLLDASKSVIASMSDLAARGGYYMAKEAHTIVTENLTLTGSIGVVTGKAKCILYEDDGDVYGFTKGQFLLTHYVAELQSSIVTVRVTKAERSWKRLNFCLHVQLLLGEGAM
ncbi:hypothetical protein UlMin_029603, partial [Ulmus minor]